MSAQWYYLENGEQTGPIGSAELKQRAQQGVLRPEDLIWREGMADWAPAAKVKGLFPTAAAPQAPAPAPLDLSADARPPLAPHPHAAQAGYHPVGYDGHADPGQTDGDLLRFSDPKWVDRVANGAFAIIVAAGLVVLLVLIAVVIGVASGSSSLSGMGGRRSGPALSDGNSRFLNLLGMLPSIATMFGVWLMTSPEPGVQQDRHDVTRPLVRYAFLVGLGWGVLITLITVGKPEKIGFVARTGDLGSLVGFFGLLIYCGALARRLPSPALRTQFQIVFWGWAGSIILMLLMLLVGTLAASAGAPPNRDTVALLTGVGCLSLFALFVFSIWFLVVIIILAIQLRKAAGQAKTSVTAHG